MANSRSSPGAGARKRSAKKVPALTTSPRAKSKPSSKSESGSGGLGSSEASQSPPGVEKATPSPPIPSFETNKAPDTKKWYRLRKDWPFPIEIGSLMFDQDSGDLAGVGIYLRLPLPWQDYLEEWKDE